MTGLKIRVTDEDRESSFSDIYEISEIMLEDDQLSSQEEGFMIGYLEDDEDDEDEDYEFE